jgi:hypothetical protein
LAAATLEKMKNLKIHLYPGFMHNCFRLILFRIYIS